MRQTQRKIKRNKKKKILNIFLITIALALLVGAFVFVYIATANRPLFISPLPPNYKINASNDKGTNTDLLKNSLKEKNIEFSEVVTSSNYYTIRLKDKSEIIFSREKDIKAQIASLQFILARLTMEGKLFTQLDLRYDKPVIRLK